MTLPPLNAAAMPTLIVGTTVIAAVALARRCWRHGCAAIGVVGGTLGGAEVLHHNLPRPDLVNAPHGLTEGSFPSGHVAIAAGLALGAALVVSPRIRPYIAAVGMLWLAFTAGAVQTLGWHRPSDTLGAALLACACYSLVARLLPPAPEQGITLRPRTLPTIALALSAAVALAASARVDSATTPLPFAAAAFLCAALLWFTAAERPTRRAMR
ncbi:phosphatase PAP2 family protein [Streptomyces sp. NPDC001404]|uniref:phosphatase PAP2 family protein n=1 Tax=Streptomyces sp. NPDC001404 TaxID=3364571 RepID=UPI00369062B4